MPLSGVPASTHNGFISCMPPRCQSDFLKYNWNPVRHLLKTLLISVKSDLLRLPTRLSLVWLASLLTSPFSTFLFSHCLQPDWPSCGVSNKPKSFLISRSLTYCYLYLKFWDPLVSTSTSLHKYPWLSMFCPKRIFIKWSSNTLYPLPCFIYFFKAFSMSFIISRSIYLFEYWILVSLTRM